MTDHTNTYPDLVNVEDWLNAKGYTGEAGACHQAMSLIRSQEKRIADLRKEADMMHSEYKTACSRIAELEEQLSDEKYVSQDTDKMFHEVRDENVELRARIAELEAALKPFADAAEDVAPATNAIGGGLCSIVMQRNHYFAARAAYLGEKND
jgi:chromosome segregation ATPase